MKTSPLFLLVLLLVVQLTASPTHAADAKGNEFFERKIRPVLIEQCARCHSEKAEKDKKLKGGLILDSREAILKGGDSGPALVPGKPGESLLIKALRYDGDVQMPPKGKLPAAVIADFEKWVSLGAPGLPSGTVKKVVGLNLEEGKKYWAYQSPRLALVPTVKLANWPSGDIDRFILAKLEASKLAPSSPADRATLLRRVYLDLIGLPPSPEAVDAFLADRHPQAYEKVVDQLLASPQFGERWGRHWLDIARFAESVTLRGFIFKQAWRYRDYVIDSLNEDVPYDRFVREQIAGDLLAASGTAERQRNLIATSYLVLGNTNLEEQDKKQLRMDVVDEQLDVIGKGLLAQTITCARCHDHKFDPIPTRDYYALAGILRNVKTMEHANVSNWIEVPLPTDPVTEAKLRQHENAVAALQGKIKLLKGNSPKTSARGILAVKDISGIVIDDNQARKVGDWVLSKHSGTYIGLGYLHDGNSGKGDKTLTFQPDSLPAGKYEVRLAYSPGTNRTTSAPVTVFSAEGEKTVSVNMQQAPPLDSRFISLGNYRFEKMGMAHVLVSNEGTKGHVTADAVVFIPLDRSEDRTRPKTNKPANNSTNTLRSLEDELKKLQASGPKRPRTMGVQEEKTIEDTQVHVRGSVHNLGPVAPRGFLQVATHGKQLPIPARQSGRRELADWIASRDNPLTARVLVNRTWHWLFGSGIVRTTDNFGTTGEMPSHPELLDHLAVTFMDDGWSIKKLIRRIVLSNTYQQSSAANANRKAADPENRLFGRTNRRRLEAECIRDAMLTISDRLDFSRGGPTYPDSLVADYGYTTNLSRRSIYLPQFRNALPEALAVFDAADPSMVTGNRNTSTVAQQALFLMNHPFPQEQARHAAAKLLTLSLNDEERITRAYRLALGRQPTTQERQIVQQFLTTSKDSQTSWGMIFHALFATPDFRFVD